MYRGLVFFCRELYFVVGSLFWYTAYIRGFPIIYQIIYLMQKGKVLGKPTLCFNKYHNEGRVKLLGNTHNYGKLNSDAYWNNMKIKLIVENEARLK